MTHCRTGCGAEINYKEVNFSGVESSYHIPMEGDIIHDCPKLTPDQMMYQEQLQRWHGFLYEELTNMSYEYGSQILDFINLPQELKLHSKAKLAERLGVNEGTLNPYNGSKLTKEDYDKMPKHLQENLTSLQGFEPPGRTAEERLAVFFSDIDHVMGLLQRCADMYPAPFYVQNGYSQLELFRIFLESKGQYSDAMMCHTIQGVIDVANTKEDKAAFAEISGRLYKKLEEQRLAKAKEDAKNSAEANQYWIRMGLPEIEEEPVPDEPYDWESYILDYSAGIMDWALSQYKKELERQEKILEKANVIYTSNLEKLEEQEAEDIAKLDQEQSLDEMMKSHSQEHFGPFHEGLRKLLLYIYNDQEKAVLEVAGKFIQDYVKMRRDKQDKKLYKMKYESDLGYATIDQLIQIFEDPKTRDKAKKKIKQYKEFLNRCREVKHIRNMMAHDEREELPKEYKVLLMCNIYLLNQFFKDLKHRHLKRKNNLF